MKVAELLRRVSGHVPMSQFTAQVVVICGLLSVISIILSTLQLQVPSSFSLSTLYVIFGKHWESEQVAVAALLILAPAPRYLPPATRLSLQRASSVLHAQSLAVFANTGWLAYCSCSLVDYILTSLS